MSEEKQTQPAPADVFIVEDHEMMRAMLAELMAALPGVTVAGVARTGEEALEQLQRIEVDVVIVDVSLEGMNGFEFLQQLRQSRPELKCLVVSGHSSKQYAERARSIGAQGYVVKGAPDAVCSGVAAILEGRDYFPDPSQSA